MVRSLSFFRIGSDNCGNWCWKLIIIFDNLWKLRLQKLNYWLKSSLDRVGSKHWKKVVRLVVFFCQKSQGVINSSFFVKTKHPKQQHGHEKEIAINGQIGVWKDLNEVHHFCQLHSKGHKEAWRNHWRWAFTCQTFRQPDAQPLGLWGPGGFYGKLLCFSTRKYLSVRPY